MNNFIKKNLVAIVILLIGVAATLMIFLPSLINVDSESVYAGTQVVFGTEIADLGPLGTVRIDPSALGIIAYLLPAVAGFAAVFFKKGLLFSTVIFIAATIMIFTIPTYTKTTLVLLGNTSTYQTTWLMGVGLIMAASLSIVGVIASLFAFVTRHE